MNRTLAAIVRNWTNKQLEYQNQWHEFHSLVIEVIERVLDSQTILLLGGIKPFHTLL
jgi:uncharacterized protein YjlB